MQKSQTHEPCEGGGRLLMRQRPTYTPSGAITPPPRALALTGSADWVTVRGGGASTVPGTMNSTVEWCPFKVGFYVKKFPYLLVQIFCTRVRDVELLVYVERTLDHFQRSPVWKVS